MISFGIAAIIFGACFASCAAGFGLHVVIGELRTGFPASIVIGVGLALVLTIVFTVLATHGVTDMLIQFIPPYFR